MKVEFNEDFGIENNEFWIEVKSDSVVELHAYIEINYDCGYLYPSVKMLWNKRTQALNVLGINSSGRLCTRAYSNVLDKNIAMSILSNKIMMDYIELPTLPVYLNIIYNDKVSKKEFICDTDTYSVYYHDKNYYIFSKDDADKSHPCVAKVYEASDKTMIQLDMSGGADSYFTIFFSFNEKELDLNVTNVIDDLMKIRSKSFKNRNVSNLLNDIRDLGKEGINLAGSFNHVEHIEMADPSNLGAKYVQFIRIPR